MYIYIYIHICTYTCTRTCAYQYKIFRTVVRCVVHAEVLVIGAAHSIYIHSTHTSTHAQQADRNTDRQHTGTEVDRQAGRQGGTEWQADRQHAPSRRLEISTQSWLCGEDRRVSRSWEEEEKRELKRGAVEGGYESDGRQTPACWDRYENYQYKTRGTRCPHLPPAIARRLLHLCIHNITHTQHTNTSGACINNHKLMYYSVLNTGDNTLYALCYL